MMKYLLLFWEFFKTGLFSVGGGLATLPFLYQMGEKTGWFTAADVADMLAVSESTPGGIGINMATYAGYTVSGVGGGIVATLGLATPSVIIIILIAMVLTKFKESKLVKGAFYGFRPTSTALIAAAGVSVISIVLINSSAFEASGNIMDLFNWGGILLAVLLYVILTKVSFTKKLHPIYFIFFSAVVGVVFRMGGV